MPKYLTGESSSKEGVSNLYLNTADRFWLGVCAGLANWLDIPAAIVRIVFILCVFAWPGFILGYFVLYFCLDKEWPAGSVRDYIIKRAPAAEHFRALNYRKPFYKNTREKKIAGVCAGLADYLEISPFSVRLFTLLSLILFGPFTFWAYVICWFVFEPDPDMTDQRRYQRIMKRRARRAERQQRRHERRAARKQARSRRGHYRNSEPAEPAAETAYSLHSSQQHFENVPPDEPSDIDVKNRHSRQQCVESLAALETRLQKMEAFMTSKRFRLHCEIKRI